MLEKRRNEDNIIKNFKQLHNKTSKIKRIKQELKMEYYP